MHSMLDSPTDIKLGRPGQAGRCSRRLAEPSQSVPKSQVIHPSGLWPISSNQIVNPKLRRVHDADTDATRKSVGLPRHSVCRPPTTLRYSRMVSVAAAMPRGCTILAHVRPGRPCSALTGQPTPHVIPIQLAALPAHRGQFYRWRICDERLDFGLPFPQLYKVISEC